MFFSNLGPKSSVYRHNYPYLWDIEAQHENYTLGIDVHSKSLVYRQQFINILLFYFHIYNISTANLWILSSFHGPNYELIVVKQLLKPRYTERSVRPSTGFLRIHHPRARRRGSNA